MSWILGLRERVDAVVRKRKIERELDEELRYHIEMETEKNVRSEMSRAEARTQALRDFGGIERVKEDVRHARGVLALEDLAQDLRYAARTLKRSPGFTVTAVLTLALAIGANTAIFSVVHAVLLRPLPYENADRLVFLWNQSGRTGSQKMPIPAPDVATFREQARLFESFAFTNRIADAALTEGDPEHVTVGAVSTNFFSLLGIKLALGRDFDPEGDIIPAELLQDSSAVTPPAPLILSHGLWQRRFGADPAVLGKTTYVNGQPAIIVGVLPEGFDLLSPPDAGMAKHVDVWAPIRSELSRFRRPEGLVDQDSDNTGAVIGRLRPGVTLAQAQAEMDAIAARQRERIALYDNADMRIRVFPMHGDVVRSVRPILLALMTAVVLVLLVSCVNVANLLLVRAIGRKKEMALRSALGAGRSRLVRQVLTESALLAGLGGMAGVLLANVGVRVLMALRPANLPRMEDIGVGGGGGAVLGFALMITAAAAVLFGSLPAFDPSLRKGVESLRVRASSGSKAGPRLRSTLVISQLALSLVLLIGAGLMLRSFTSLQQVRPGFDPDGILAFNLSLRHPERYQGPAARARFIRGLEERLSALPGVARVGLIGRLPLAGRIWTRPFGLKDQEDWSGNEADFRMITSGYLPTMGTRLLAGRLFTEEEDLFEHDRVVIVDEKMARRIAANGNAVGKRLGFPLDGKATWAEVVGVVEHVRHETLREDGRETIYVPYRQEASRDIAIVVRASGNPTGVIGPIKRELGQLDPQLPMYNVRTMRGYVADAVAPTRFTLLLIAVFAVVALLLASVGLYGVVSYSVRQRTNELGIRLALGAQEGTLVRSIVGDGLVLTGIGLFVGLALAVPTSRLLSTILFGVRPTDIATYVVVSLTLAAVALLATYLPARAVGKLDPARALRAE